jgi:hypothetical protein
MLPVPFGYLTTQSPSSIQARICAGIISRTRAHISPAALKKSSSIFYVAGKSLKFFAVISNDLPSFHSSAR